jgi:mannitol/fructose-specific phosphotransferase system IIA component (Ntr-type)
MRLMDIIHPGSVIVPLKAVTKQDAIFELVDVLADQAGISSRQELKDAVWQREMTRTTGLGYGIAIPHGKCRGCEKLSMAVGRTSTPIDFKSIDGKPVEIIVLLASPPDQTGPHIHALARITRIMTNDRARMQIKQAPTSKALYDLLSKLDSELPQ